MSKKRYTNSALIKSSQQFKRCFKRPKKYSVISIDRLAITIPVPKELIKKVYCIQRLRTADVFVTYSSLDSEQRFAQKYKKKFLIHFSNGSSASIFCYGLNEKMNQLKIDFNPNVIGYDNVKFIFDYLRNLFGEQSMRGWLQRSKVTSIHYALDFPNVRFEDFVIDYAYSPKYEYMTDAGTSIMSTIRFGNKSGCPIILYDKVLEQKSEYKGYDIYVRLEKQHRPQQRGRKSMFTLADIDKQQYSFQGVKFYDPLILNNMPERVLALIREYGICKAVGLLNEEDRAKLSKRMEKYRIVQTAVAKAKVIESFQANARQLKNLIINR